MNTVDPLLTMAEQVMAIEREGAALTRPWYTFEPPKSGDPERLHALLQQSKETLDRMAPLLDERVRGAGDRDRPALQHAYNLVAELRQSREATEALLQADREGTRGYQEDFRALAIKEQAAEQQARQLFDVLRRIQ
ncbi:hypothetical protein [Alicyclobacillus sp.]|uniref:hypothetical protein n=1 Tax=Alicyclobacillus sp. TaxID=61169 RepID=UPI0025C44316|nr:hypothetical protein [Alicyclobacillus sp.]MCL6515667.1 hypothetical protein [Alicyclobacillus sp.]